MHDIMQKFKAGDRVRHVSRPEWGIGVIQRVENLSVAGKPSQRLLVRFSNAGIKTLSSLGATLMKVDDSSPDGASGAHEDTLVGREGAAETGWLGEISKRKPEHAMMEIPSECSDRFLPLEARLKRTLDLYRFSPQGGSLIDWAVARSGLDDPLSRFNRHELEQFFDRWSFLRDRHLASLLKEAQIENGLVQRLLKDAPPAARRAVQRSGAAC